MPPLFPIEKAKYPAIKTLSKNPVCKLFLSYMYVVLVSVSLISFYKIDFFFQFKKENSEKLRHLYELSIKQERRTVDWGAKLTFINID